MRIIVTIPAIEDDEKGADEVAEEEKGDEVSIRMSSITVAFSSGTLGAIFVAVVVDVVVSSRWFLLR